MYEFMALVVVRNHVGIMPMEVSPRFDLHMDFDLGCGDFDLRRAAFVLLLDPLEALSLLVRLGARSLLAREEALFDIPALLGSVPENWYLVTIAY
ncbi:hypothetical protein LOZ66_000753 [Ophidiomyces ophidiicola]|nr:hypothetical protein LOZ66_000753 [Ophidiomyces ophidiicola]